MALSPIFKSHKKLVFGNTGRILARSVSTDLESYKWHTYVVGSSGSGKSKFLQHLLFQFANSDKWGCGVIDPHGDLADDLLCQLTNYPNGNAWLDNPENAARLVYLDPTSAHTVPFNILKNSFSNPSDTAENIIEAFKRTWPTTLEEAPRFTEILSNSLIALIHTRQTLLEVSPLLTVKQYREWVLAQCPDPQVVGFFHHQYDRWGRDQAIFAESVLNKVNAFLFNPAIRAMLGSSENKLDARSIMDQRKVFIVNLGGINSEDSKNLLGCLLLTQFEKGAFSRANIEPADRKKFKLFVDEFPIFLSSDAKSFTTTLEQNRKYGLFMCLSHQGISQLQSERMEGAIKNAKTQVIFNVDYKTAGAIADEVFRYDAQAIKHEIEDEAQKPKSHPVFKALFEQREEQIQLFLDQKPRHMILKHPESKVKALKKCKVPKVPERGLTMRALSKLKEEINARVGHPLSAKVIAGINKRIETINITGAKNRNPLTRNTGAPAHKTIWS